MTRKGKIVCIFLFIISILLKEEIYAFLFKANLKQEIHNTICETQNKILEEKYQELVKAYGYEDQFVYHLEESKILFRDIYDLNKKITIFKGAKDGIQEKNLVVNEQGLVGIVCKVHQNSSDVDLITKEDTNLSVKINDNYGLLKYENQEFIVSGINNKGEVTVGDSVYTSDISIYPEKILIGQVAEVKFDHYEIEKVIKVKPAVDFKNLKFISIIKDLRGEE